MKKSPIIGIVGGIGSGKSTVADAFAAQGCTVIDADRMAHSLLEREDVRAQLIDIIGAGILGPNGLIDRSILGQIVFKQPEAMKFLTDLLHPKILEQTECLIDKYRRSSQDLAAIVLDMPLLFETGWDKRCDYIIFVDCDESVRRARVEKCGKFDADQIKNRENLQISLDKKRENAHYGVNNNSDESDIAGQVALILASIKGSI